ncbi:MAG: hypothetical protein PVI07_06050 [Anaerolineae bacterium]|jgi:transglutaminase-like putative cysteine protease
MKRHVRYLPCCWLLGGLLAACLFAVAFLVLYPHSTRYVQNLDRALHPPIDPVAVAQVSAALPEDPSLIERWVGTEIVFDANDYAAWGVVLYIATPEEVLRRGRGPCYGRAVVLASILEAKGISYRLMANTTCGWPTRVANRSIGTSACAVRRSAWWTGAGGSKAWGG